MANEKIRIEHILSSDRSGDGDRLATVNTGDSLATNVPLIYAAGNVSSTATRTGNTVNYATAVAGAKTSGNYPKWDGNGNLTDGDAGGGGSFAGKWGFDSVTDPPTTGWTAINSASVVVYNGSRIMSVPASGSDNQRLEVRTISGDFFFEAYLTNIRWAADFSSAGICLYESGTGKFVTYQVSNTAIVGGNKYNSVTSFNAIYTMSRNITYRGEGPFGFRLTYGPTNRVIEFTQGNDWVTIHTVAKDDFATTAFDRYGWVGNVTNNDVEDVELFHWLEG